MAESPQAPQIPCDQCGVIMHIYLQPATEDDPAAYFVTCRTIACPMRGHTLSANPYPPPNLRVYLNPHDYEEVVWVYIGLIRRDSLQAAAAIEQIYATVSPQAALHAALIMTIFRMELKQNRWIPDKGVYAYLIRDYPQAVLLLEYAMGCCLQAWGMHELALVQLRISDSGPSDAHKQPPTPRN